MEDTLLFIPPCCVDRKLPRAIMQAPHYSLTFYTHSDVTLEKFYRAVGYMLEQSHTMVVSMTFIAVETLAFFLQCFERGWINALVLSTAKDCSAMIDKYLSDYKDKYLSDYKNKVLYVQHRDATDWSSHLVLYSADKALIIEGPMYSRIMSAGLTTYHATFYPLLLTCSNSQDWGNPLRNALFPDVLRHRQGAKQSKRTDLCSELTHFLNVEFPPYE